MNIYAAWIGFLMGCLSGAVPGLFFYRKEWLGGYSSWPRRMIRLGHISFFGVGFLNLSFALTVRSLELESRLFWPSFLLILGSVSMPSVCYLSAWKPLFRYLFFMPALSLTLAIALFVWRLFS